MLRSLDHVAVPMRNIEAMLSFYEKLGCHIKKEYDGLLYSVSFGNNRINFHTPALWEDVDFSLRGPNARPGCGDFCFVWDGDEHSLSNLFQDLPAEIEEGPVERNGGRNRGDIGISRYIRDPDANLLEFIIYKQD